MTAPAEEEQSSIEITHPMRAMFKRRWEAFKALTEVEGNERKGIEPIKIEFSAQYEGRDGQLQTERYTEQGGLRLKGMRKGRDITILAGTHQNESTGFEAVRTILDNWESIRKGFPGNINILLGGEPQTVRTFFNDLSHDYADGRPFPEGFSRRPEDGAITITPQKLTSYRNTTKNENCNRVSKTPVSNVFKTEHTTPDAKEKRHADFQGTASWLKQKNDSYRQYYKGSDLVLDLHSLSRMGEMKTLMWFYDPNTKWIPDPTETAAKPGADKDSLYHLLADMGAQSLSVKNAHAAPADYMASSGYEGNQRIPHMMLETGHHLSERAGEISIEAVSAVLARHMGVPRIQHATKRITRLDGEKLLFTPGSANANEHTEVFVPIDAQGVGDPAHGKWGEHVHIVSAREELPPKLQKLAEGLPFPEDTLNNGGKVAAGDVVSYTYWHPQQGDPVPVFLKSKHGGITYMAPLYTKYDQTDRTHTIEVYTDNKEITVSPSLHNGKELSGMLDTSRTSRGKGV